MKNALSQVLNKTKTLLQALGRLAQHAVGMYIPRTLPLGTQAFEALVDRLMATYPLPTEDRASVAFVVATAIINGGTMTTRRPDSYFLTVINSGAAKQIAGAAFQAIKQKQIEAQKAAQQAAAAQSTAEAPATPGASSGASIVQPS